MLKMYFGGISLITKSQDLIPTLNFSTLKKFPEPSEFNKMLKGSAIFHPPLFIFACLWQSPKASAIAQERVAVAQQITTCQLSCGNLSSCLL